MSLKAIDWAFSVEGVMQSDKFILVALAHYSNAEFICWPSLKTLANKVNLNVRSVKRSINNLTEIGLITKIGKSDKSFRGGKSTVYLINIVDKKAKKPSDTMSPGDAQAPPQPSDTMSPGDIHDINLVTLCPIAYKDARALENPHRTPILEEDPNGEKELDRIFNAMCNVVT